MAVIFALLFAKTEIVIGVLVKSEIFLIDGMFSLISFSLTLLSIFAMQFKKNAHIKKYPFGVNSFDFLS